jgi:hypothetical protein
MWLSIASGVAFLSVSLFSLLLSTMCASLRVLPTVGRGGQVDTASGSARYRGHLSPASHSRFLRKGLRSPLLSSQQNVDNLDSQLSSSVVVMQYLPPTNSNLACSDNVIHLLTTLFGKHRLLITKCILPPSFVASSTFRHTSSGLLR